MLLLRPPKVQAYQIREAQGLLQPGDVIARTWAGAMDNLTLPGKYKHTMIYVGGSRIIHAVAEGVVTSDVLTELMHCDRFAVFRPVPPYDADKAITFAQDKLGTPYDFVGNSKDRSEFFCHELVVAALEAGNRPVWYTGRWPLADDIAAVSEVIYETNT